MIIIIGSILLGLAILFLGITLNIKFHNGESTTDSWHVWLYKRLWCFEDNYRLPKNICNYFWNYLLGVLLFPFTIILVIIGLFSERIRDNVDKSKLFIFSLLNNFTIFFIIFLGTELLYETRLNLSFLNWVYSISLSLGIFAGIIGLIFSVAFISDKIKDKKYNRIKTPNLFIERIKDWKNKSCTRINWK